MKIEYSTYKSLYYGFLTKAVRLTLGPNNIRGGWIRVKGGNADFVELRPDNHIADAFCAKYGLFEEGEGDG
jgi:hypothetical protein